MPYLPSIRSVSAGTLFLLIAGCSTQPSVPENATVCPSERPQMCTRDYRPVCGSVGGTHKTYSNGCEACSHADVEFFVPGTCEGAGHGQ